MAVLPARAIPVSTTALVVRVVAPTHVLELLVLAGLDAAVELVAEEDPQG